MGIRRLIGLSFIICHLSFSHAGAQVWPVTDPAMMKSLNGQWLLKVEHGIDDSQPTVPAADASWRPIPVPGCWEAHGFCEPRYDYPDSLTGYYRTTFTLPQAWRGQQVYIRLDGVLRGYDLWLNGQRVGSWQSAYNTCIFNLTPYLTRRAFKGEDQQLAMRVYSRFKGYEFDCFDDWATMGIFRDVTLMAVPATHLSDLTVVTHTDGRFIVSPTVANATRHTTVSYELLDAEGHVVSTGGPVANPRLWTAETPVPCGFPARVTVANPRLWTAETPYLYVLKVYLKERDKTLQTFTHRIGIREISIAGRSNSPLDTVRNVLMVNGKPVKLRGVNAHSTDPTTVKVISDSLTLKDMHLMKEASVNFLRLSHYPREPRFYELADSMGFYIVDEVPFGFGDKHLSDRSYQDILMTRARATVQRDKLHPSVIMWSVGNENPLPQTCVEVGDYVGRLDPSRPYCFPQVGSYFRRFWEKNNASFPSDAPVYASHYPTTGQIGGFYQHLDRPVVFTEYCHTLGISFEDHDRQWEIIERTPGIAGGAVWEWADQGMPFKGEKFKGEKLKGEKVKGDSDELRAKYGYEEKVYTSENGGYEMYGNKGTDGLLYADRTPLPNYYELQRNYARAFIRSVRPVCCDLIATSSTDAPASIPSALTLTILNRYDFLNLKDNVTFHWTVTADRDTLATGAFSPDCAPRDSVDYALSLPAAVSTMPSRRDAIRLLNVTVTDAQGHTFLRQSFPISTADLTSRFLSGLTEKTSDPMSLVQTGILVRAGRKATLAEMVKVADKRLERYLLPLSADGKSAGPVAVDLQSETVANATHFSFALTPDTTDTFLSELGIAFLLDKCIDRVQWIGNGPMPTYPGRCRAGRYGFWCMQQGDLYFEGNRMGVDAALLTDKNGGGLLLFCRQGNVSFEQTDRGIVLTYNAAVSGQGPKFRQTAFPVIARQVGTVAGDFYLYRVEADRVPQLIHDLFDHPRTIPAPFRPFLTQYDTYLMRYEDICQ